MFENGNKFAKRKKGTLIGPHATIGGEHFFEVEKAIERLRENKKGKLVSEVLFDASPQTSCSPIS